MMLPLVIYTTNAQYPSPNSSRQYDIVVETAPPMEVQATSAKIGTSFAVFRWLSTNNYFHVALQYKRDQNFPEFNYAYPNRSDGVVINSHAPQNNTSPYYYTVNGLSPSTTYYYRAVVFHGSHRGYYSKYGEIYEFTTPAADGSTPITNNRIKTGNVVVCNDYTGSYNIIGSTPQGGLNNQYTYAWQQATGESPLIWTPITNNNVNYTLPEIPASGKLWLKRTVVSGAQTDDGNVISVERLGQTKILVEEVITNNATGITLNCEPGGESVTWQKKENGSWFNYATANTLTFTNNDNKYYRASVSFGSGGCTLNSEPFIITPPDGDDNLYAAVVVDDKLWMINNLRTTKTNTRTDLVLLENGSTNWETTTAASYGWYNDVANDVKALDLGALYNREVTDNVCPTDWRIATYNDWTSLRTEIGGTTIAGQKLKSTSDYWKNGGSGTNEYNFNILPAGSIRKGGAQHIGTQTVLFSDRTTIPGIAQMYTNNILAIETGNTKVASIWGLSIRCVKDLP